MLIGSTVQYANTQNGDCLYPRFLVPFPDSGVGEDTYYAYRTGRKTSKLPTQNYVNRTPQKIDDRGRNNIQLEDSCLLCFRPKLL